MASDLKTTSPASGFAQKGSLTSLSSAPAGGFNANLRGASLLDLVQMECLSMGRSAVKVVGPHGIGFLYFSGGQIVHAVCGEKIGEAAALEILGWSSGSFEKLSAFDWPESETIFCLWQSLAMRAAQERDEAAADKLVAFPKTEGGAAGQTIRNTPNGMEDLLARIEHLGAYHAAVEVAPDGAIRKSGEAAESLAGLIAYASTISAQIGKLLGGGELLTAEFESTLGYICSICLPDGRTFGFQAASSADVARLREALVAMLGEASIPG